VGQWHATGAPVEHESTSRAAAARTTGGRQRQAAGGRQQAAAGGRQQAASGGRQQGWQAAGAGSRQQSAVSRGVAASRELPQVGLGVPKPAAVNSWGLFSRRCCRPRPSQSQISAHTALVSFEFPACLVFRLGRPSCDMYLVAASRQHMALRGQP